MAHSAGRGFAGPAGQRDSRPPDLGIVGGMPAHAPPESCPDAGKPEVMWFSSRAEADRAAEDLRGLGHRARQLLEQCVETQGLTRKRPSAAAQQLEDNGFVFIRQLNYWDTEVLITPSLWGEEALEMLEWMDSTQAGRRTRPGSDPTARRRPARN